MQNSQHQTNDKIEKQCVTITLGSLAAAALNGIISVIVAYFFKPVWERIMKMIGAKQNYWNKK